MSKTMITPPQIELLRKLATTHRIWSNRYGERRYRIALKDRIVLGSRVNDRSVEALIHVGFLAEDESKPVTSRRQARVYEVTVSGVTWLAEHDRQEG